jgi:hypothetical protein
LLESLHAQNASLKEELEKVKNDIDTLERPQTALSKDGNAQDGAEKRKWMEEREAKKLLCAQTEASANNLQREMKNRAKIHAAHIIQLKMQLSALSTLVNENLNE